MHSFPYDLIIIGSGPAGATAAIYAKRKGLAVLLLSAGIAESQIVKAAKVDNWPGSLGVSGLQIMQNIEKHLQALDIEIVSTTVKAISRGAAPLENQRGAAPYKVEGAGGEEFLARSVIVATGAISRPLGIKGEKELLGRGVAYCAICEAPFFKDKQVAVVGGGNAGAMAVLDLLKYAKKVCWFEFAGALSAESALVDAARASGKLEIFLNSQLLEILGKDKVEAIIFEKEGKKFQQPMAGVFIAVGYKANTDFLAGFVELNEKEEVVVDAKTLQTSVEGVFACGDVSNASPYKQLIVSAGQGAAAALSAYKYLQRQTKTPA